jgi:hypothetical protein
MDNTMHAHALIRLLARLQMCGQVAEPYREFAERWGNPEFMEYASVLEMQANAALAATDQVGERSTAGTVLWCMWCVHACMDAEACRARGCSEAVR